MFILELPHQNQLVKKMAFAIFLNKKLGILWHSFYRFDERKRTLTTLIYVLVTGETCIVDTHVQFT